MRGFAVIAILAMLMVYRLWSACTAEYKFGETHLLSTQVWMAPSIKWNGKINQEQQVVWLKHGEIPIYAILPLVSKISIGDTIEFRSEVNQLGSTSLCKRGVVVDRTGDLKVLSRNEFMGYMSQYRDEMFKNLSNNLNYNSGGIVRALVFGDSRGVADDLLEVFRSAGLIHLLVVSGYNISLVTRFSIQVVRGVLNYYLAYLFGFFVMICYVFMVGFGPPVVRASVLYFFVILAEVTGRPRSVGYLFCLCVMGMIIYDPYWLTDVSWQLSVIATSALVFPIFDLSKFKVSLEKRKYGTFIFFFLESFVTSLQVAIWVLPIIMWHFGEMTFASILTTPMVGWMIMPITLGGFVLSLGENFLWSPLLLVFSWTMDMFTMILVLVANIFASLNLEIFVKPTYTVLGIYYVVLIMIVKLVSIKKY